MSPRLVLAASASFLLTVAPAFGGTPLGGDDGGFLPPDAATKRCEEKVVSKAYGDVKCVLKCHIKAADLAVNGRVFDEEACEQGCQDKLALRVNKVIAQESCPPCTGAMVPAIAFGAEQFGDAINGDIYCASGTAFGGDDQGNVPPDHSTGKCEDRAVLNVLKLMKCISNFCHFRGVRAAFRGNPFDDEVCEQGRCRAQYDQQVLLGGSCPPCLDAAAQATIATQAEQFSDQTLGSIYCASPGGAFLGEGS